MADRVAVVQMTSSSDLENNFAQCEYLIGLAKKLGADCVCLPENFAFMGSSDHDSSLIAGELNGPRASRFLALAKKFKVWLSLGGFQEKSSAPGLSHNTHIVVNSVGEIAAFYRKIHLFSVSIPDGQRYDEAATVAAGDKTVVTNSPFGNLGLSICYDLRFPSLYQSLTAQGAQLLLIPAAFTAHTGKDHWEILLRARAIENQCYVAAAAQVGTHNNQRKTHGHAMIVDPWGTIIAQTSRGQPVAVASVDLSYLEQIRKNMPVLLHRRPNFYNA